MKLRVRSCSKNEREKPVKGILGLLAKNQGTKFLRALVPRALLFLLRSSLLWRSLLRSGFLRGHWFYLQYQLLF